VLSDVDYMERALDLAERGRGRTSPNPMVGAVIVDRDGAIVGQGYHEAAGRPHAEVVALDEAGSLARGATLYCTLEPCSHTGRTGPCVERIATSGISRVVAAIEDPDPRVSGSGFRFLRDRGIEVAIGAAHDRAVELNRAFLTFVTKRRPFVIAKAATSADNRVAARRGARSQISSPESIRHAHGVRAEVDAIGVGSETVLVDDPMLTARAVSRVRPLTRVIFDRRLRVQPSARVFSTLEAGPVIIMTTAQAVAVHPDAAKALAGAGARLESMVETDLASAFRRLAEKEIQSLILEGGPSIQRAAMDAHLVDAIHLYVAPVTMGNDGVAWLSPEESRVEALIDRRKMRLGPDTFIEGYVHRID
jgi:diaminohydroxyphosphoribosylaminopyrimidine deaminase/5-amino-6-(5-phosphoribosylamino)uracil reductase